MTTSTLGTYIIILITTPDRENAEKIARTLISRKLAACINIVNDVSSIFLWKGSVEETKENLLIIKSRLDVLDEVIDEVKKIHPYEVPEVIAIPIIYGLKKYLEWIDEVLER
ncbi:MAG: cytochrome C biogenesis protein CcdA [Thermoprotei archaeon ex4572_64]|nr:MAG: cytochrome C biogenesis protein CcdA [Thermoprotei archaeon ex4572_64]